MKTPTLLITLLLTLTLLPGTIPAHNTTNPTFAAVLIPDTTPILGLLAASLACNYDPATNHSLLLPLLIAHNQTLTAAQDRLLAPFFTQDNQRLLVLGSPLTTTYPTHPILGTPTQVSYDAALQTYQTAPTVLLIPATEYRLGLAAAPLASYLHCPLLLTDTNTTALQATLDSLQTQTAILIGPANLTLTNITIDHLATLPAIQTRLLQKIHTLFGRITYLTMTNPADATPPTVTTTTTTQTHRPLQATQLILLGRTHTLKGNSTATLPLTIPDGLTHLTITATIPPGHHLITPLLFLRLTDPNGSLAAYTSSQALQPGTASLQTLACHDPGTYHLTIRVFHGLQGGYFSYRGFSAINTTITITTQLQNQSTPHLPLIPGLSMLASYLAAAHGGIIVLTDHELTSIAYEQAAAGSAAGPWYTPNLLAFNNQAANQTLADLTQTLSLLDDHAMLDLYLAGPAWLGILGDTTMIPMYYDGPTQADLDEQGLPTDNLYSLGDNLSTGRVIGWNATDASTLIARTLFYPQVCSEPTDPWFSTFNFIFGEGFGETGGLFHQVPYSREIRQYGFTTRVYGDLRNGRQFTSLTNFYLGSNFIEYMGHGDWYWYAPSLYGMNTYGRAVDVAHASTWVFERPSVFLTAACLLGRVDGIPPEQNLGLAMLHAGCCAFVGATRETGSEAGLSTLENHLIVNDSSLGEALRMEKRTDHELPTYLVRTLYGDPAFNPFDPLHGFSNQGRPQLLPP